MTAEFSTFNLVGTYVPNAGVMGLDRLSYRVKEWDTDFHLYLKNLETATGKAVVWCGDLNVAHHPVDIYNAKGKEKSAGFTKEERESFGAFLTNREFVDTFRHLHPNTVKYSYWNLRSGARNRNEGWRLDYFVTSKFMLPAVVSSEINDEYHGSDHCPLSLTLNPHLIPIQKPNPEAATKIVNQIAPSPIPAAQTTQAKSQPTIKSLFTQPPKVKGLID